MNGKRHNNHNQLRNEQEITSTTDLSFCLSSVLQKQLHNPLCACSLRLEDKQQILRQLLKLFHARSLFCIRPELIGSQSFNICATKILVFWRLILVVTALPKYHVASYTVVLCLALDSNQFAINPQSACFNSRMP